MKDGVRTAWRYRDDGKLVPAYFVASSGEGSFVAVSEVLWFDEEEPDRDALYDLSDTINIEMDGGIDMVFRERAWKFDDANHFTAFLDMLAMIRGGWFYAKRGDRWVINAGPMLAKHSVN